MELFWEGRCHISHDIKTSAKNYIEVEYGKDNMKEFYLFSNIKVSKSLGWFYARPIIIDVLHYSIIVSAGDMAGVVGNT